jgi:hypothetical protein
MKTIKKLLFTFLATLSVLAVDAKTILIDFNGNYNDPANTFDVNISTLCGCSVHVGDVIRFMNKYASDEFHIESKSITESTWNPVDFVYAPIDNLIKDIIVEDKGYIEVIRIYPDGAKNSRQTKYKIDVTPTKTVSFSASTNGSLTAEVDGAQIASGYNIEVGKDVTFTATPSTGYKVSAWYVNSTLEAGNTTNTLVVTNIQENTTVSVEFELITFAVNFSMNVTNGSLIAEIGGVEITTGDVIEYGSTIDFTVTPDAGYKVESWVVNGSVVSGNTTNQLQITATSATNVVVNLGTVLSASLNDKVNFSIYPNPTADFINVDGVDVKNVKVFNLDGQLVLNDTTNKVDVSNLYKGIYILIVNDSITTKFVKN